LAAGLATEGLVGDDSQASGRDMLLALALLLLHDPIERARVAAVTVLSRLSEDRGPGASAAHASLVAALADPRLAVRERAIEALVRADQRAIPLLHEQLNAADPHLRKMIAVVLARIEPRKYASLVLEANLNDSLLAIYRNLSCLQALADCPGQATAMLGRALRELNASLLDETVYLLATARDPTAIKTIAHSLRSPQPEVRANATEALESLTTPQTATLVGALFEPAMFPNGDDPQPSGQVLSLARQIWDISIPTPTAALRLLLSDASDAWQRTLAAAALVELSATSDPLPRAEVMDLLDLARRDPDACVRAEVGVGTDEKGASGGPTLPTVEKVIFLKEVPFFQEMTVEQLRVLAGACDEEFFSAESRLYNEGDAGGVLYIVVSGRVGIEQEKRKGSFARLATVEAGSYLGEADFFGDNARTNSAIAIQDTLVLRLRREPLIALARQDPDLSLALINVLSARLRDANDRIAELTHTHPRKLHELYDQLI